eukprot:gb/GFBE01050033.1/.p1 GENE.gb/GFBE01050033.1/~~gb/GFBE01050033.1/.p1  ORF type:complete len:294 (+),score=37.07 gb/GFBE01050033.1/:1-882(+)
MALRRRAMAPTRTQALVAAAAAAFLLAANAGSAFLVAGQPSVASASALGASATATPVVRYAAPAVRPSSFKATEFISTAASAALLCLAAAALRSSAATSRAAFKVRAVPCKAFAPAMAPAATISAPPRAIEVEPLVDLETAPQLPQPVVQQVNSLIDLEAAPKLCQLPTQAPPAQLPTAEPSSRVTRQPSPARLAGGARKAWNSRRQRSNTARAAHRATGQRLRTRTVTAPVAAPSFDPSTVRMKIQLGLRVSSSFRSEHGREAKSPSALEGSDMSTGLRIQANEFRESCSDK